MLCTPTPIVCAPSNSIHGASHSMKRWKTSSSCGRRASLSFSNPFSHGVEELPSPPLSDDDRDHRGRFELEEGCATPEPMSRLPSIIALPTSLTPPSEALQHERRSTVLVVGVGYVGMHLVERFSARCDVVGLDLDANRCSELQREFEARGVENVTMVSNIEDDERTSTFDMALISVPTLLLEDNKTVDTRHIKAAVEEVSRRARPGSIVVIESSVTVGMTRALLGPQGVNLRASGVFVGFSPERVDPGRAFPSFEEIPKIVSGIDEESLHAITKVYSQSFRTVVPVASLETAEFTKLYENCQRLMLIAYVNEMANACEAHGVDIHDVCAASATKPFGFTPFTPSLGAGGHCIPVNPWYLLSNCDIPLLKSAAESNQQRPVRKAEQIARVAKEASSARGDVPSVLIYGMGFKAGQGSLAYAPAVTLARALERQGCRVSYYDNHVTSTRWPRLSKLDQTQIDARYDVVVVAQIPLAADEQVIASLARAQIVRFVR